jgi:hypothetical protein
VFFSRRRRLAAHRPIWPMSQTGLTGAPRDVPSSRKRWIRSSRSFWPSTMRREQDKSKGVSQVKVKIRNFQQKIKIYLVLANLKKIMLLHLIHMLDRPHRGPGHILTIIHLWIMLIYICVHIWSNILLHNVNHGSMQSSIVLDSNMVGSALKEVIRTAMNQNTHSRGGVPQA